MAKLNYDYVGSFLRPEYLKDARREFEEGKITADALEKVENSAIEELTHKLEKAGYHDFTDGEFRRRYWHLDFLVSLLGTEEIKAEKWSVDFKGKQPKAATAKIVGKLGFDSNNEFLKHFDFLKSITPDDVEVVDLAKKVARYSGPINLHVVNFTDIQLAIYEKCPHDELTIIMRRYMMKIAEHFAYENKCLGLITGESIGQVASQTMQSLAATNEVCTMPVYRPLIALDKQDIVEIAEKIDTYETSIQPFEDCCTIFVAKHPVTKPNLKYIKKSEENLNDCIEELMKKAIETVETIHVDAE